MNGRDSAPPRVSYSPVGHEFCYGAEERSFWFAHRNRVILAALERFPPPGEIADIGAGNGFVSIAMQNAGLDVLAIEPGELGAAHARERGVRRVVHGTVKEAGLRPASIGGIALFDVIEHVEDDAAFLRSTMRYLKADGRIYITTPAHQALWSSEDAFAGHFRRYSLPAIMRTCREAGLEVDFASYFFSLLPPAIFLARVLPEKLRLVQPRSTPTSIHQHDLGGSPLRKIAETVFGPEASLIAAGRSIPFGASCLAVARRPHVD